nr:MULTISPECIES: carboxymuconolactone decarboxylase family protein [Pseudofrankia]
MSEWTEEDRELLRGNLTRADRYLSGEADAPPMPAILGLFARHSRVGGPWLAFSGTLLDDGALDPRDRELLILRVGHRTGCRYQWAQHVGMAQTAGLTLDEIAAVAAGVASDAAGTTSGAACVATAADGWTDRDRDLLRAVDQLVDDHVIDDATWARLAAHLDERQLLELTFVVGGYVCLAMVLNSVGLEPAALPDPDGAKNGRTVPDAAPIP